MSLEEKTDEFNRGYSAGRNMVIRQICNSNRPEDRCPKCLGIGRRDYPSTATWRGGVGGSAITGDVCDSCWGTGNRHYQGVDLSLIPNEVLKEVYRKQQKRLEEKDNAKT